WDRDHFFASVFRSENLLIAQSTPGSGTSEKATGGNLTWSHDLSALTTTNLGVGFTHFDFPTLLNSEENLFSAIASVQYLFNASLKGWLGYSFLNRTSPQPQLRLVANSIFVGLRKDF